jgi:hypothetical protein
MERKRQNDRYFERVEKVFQDFEQKHGVWASGRFALGRNHPVGGICGVAINSPGIIYLRHEQKRRLK